METNDFIKKPLISIIITYYNMGSFICDCVDSINAQNYKNFEIIIVNDGSDQKNSEILEKIKNAKIINLEKNQGQLSALCEGLKEARGEFICMVDADDILLPNYLITLLKAHLNSNYALISANKGEINEKGEIISLNQDIAKVNYSEVENLLKTKADYEIKKVKAPYGLWSWNPSTSAMWRKNAIELLKYYPDKTYWRSGADKVIFSLLHLIGGSANIDSTLFLYRIHSNNNFNSTNFSGNKKYLSDGTVNKLINWNIKLRIDTIKMFIKNKREICEKYNKINYYKMFFRVIFCIDLKVILKIFKAILYKLVR